MNRTIGIALICVFSSTGRAQVPSNRPSDAIWKPPHIVEGRALPAATVPREMIDKLQVSNMSIVLEKTHMTSVRQRFGGTFGEDGDAGDSTEWLCLRGGDATGPWVLWLKSGEIDDATVGSFQWRRVARDAQFDERCGALPKSTGGVEMPIAIVLGMQEAKVLRILGRPTTRRGNDLLYMHEHEEVIHNQSFRALNTVIVVIRDGVVWAIEVLKATTS